MSSDEWEAYWWDEYERLRVAFPATPLIVIHKASTTYMVKRYGQKPAEGPSLKDKVVRALALRWLRGKMKDLRSKDRETDMGKVLKFLDGWKLVIFALVLFGSRIYDAAHNGHTGDIVGAVFAALGMTPAAASLDPAAIGAAATGALAIWGVFSRVYKAQKQLRAGSSVSGLLSTEGFAVSAKADAKEAKTDAKEAAADKR